MHPLGRTGVSERGLLGRYGPNHAADPVVSRFKRSGDGGIEYDGEGRPKVEFVLIQRTDNNMWAIPGGMVDKGEAFSATLKRLVCYLSDNSFPSFFIFLHCLTTLRKNIKKA